VVVPAAAAKGAVFAAVVAATAATLQGRIHSRNNNCHLLTKLLYAASKLNLVACVLVMHAVQLSADPWAAGFDPWAASAAIAAAKPSAPQPPPLDLWQPFVKGAGKSHGCTIGGCCKGGKPTSIGKQCCTKGGSLLSKGRKTGPPILQTQKIRDWHVDPVQQGPEEQVDEGKPSRGRGRSLVQPAWKTSTGLNNPLDTLATWTAVGGCTSNAPEKKSDIREKHKQDRLWLFKLPNLIGILGEAEVLKDCNGLCPGDWLPCQVGDLVFVVYAFQDLAYAMAYCYPERHMGWVPVSHLGPNHSGEHHEFIVSIVAHAADAKPLGLGWARSKGPIPGLVVVHVSPNSLLDKWNTRCCATFPRDQVIAGDLITWVNGSSESENMQSSLLDVKQQVATGMKAVPLKLRIIRNHSALALQSTASQTLSELLAHRDHGEEKQFGKSSAETPLQSASPDIPRAAGADIPQAAGADMPRAAGAEMPLAVAANSRAGGADPWVDGIDRWAGAADPWAGGADPWAAAARQEVQASRD